MLTQIEIAKLARDFVDSLTDRERLFAARSGRFSRNDANTEQVRREFGEEYGNFTNRLTEKQIGALEIIDQNYKGDAREQEEAGHIFNQEIAKILMKEQIIDNQEIKKIGPERPSRRLS